MKLKMNIIIFFNNNCFDNHKVSHIRGVEVRNHL